MKKISPRATVELDLSESEEVACDQARHALFAMLRMLLNQQVPALAVVVAAADTFAEAGTCLIAMDQQANGSTVNSRQALRDVMRILDEYFDRQAAGVEFEAIPSEGKRKEPVH